MPLRTEQLFASADLHGQREGLQSRCPALAVRPESPPPVARPGHGDDALRVLPDPPIRMMPSISTPKLRRPLGLLALVALALLLLAPAGAPARTARAHPTGCPAAAKRTVRHAARHAATRRCAKHPTPAKTRRHGGKPAGKKAPGGSPTVELAPATCEDGSVPTHSATGFSCEDGSAVVCDDGSAPTRVSRSGAPLCPVLKEGRESEGLECALGSSGECATVEWTCKDPREPEEAAQPCESGPAVEAED